MKVFFDTSAFAKRYLEEPGTEKVIEICGQAEELVLSIVCVPEMMATLNRLVREEKISRRAYVETRNLILQEIREVEFCCITGAVVSQAIRCFEEYSLGAMAALSLGSALVAKPDLFISSHPLQIEVARTEGLKVLLT
jgi:uncharacterized protein with PIN domain